MKKALAVILTLATLLCMTGLFASCAGDGGEGNTTTASETTETTTEESTEESTEATTEESTEVTTEATEITYRTDALGNILSGIPDDVDFEEEVIKILTWQEYCRWNFPKSGTGTDVVENTVYLRNLDLAERFNCVLDVNNTVNGAYGQNEWLTLARKAGDEGFDFFCAYTGFATTLASEGLLVDLNRYDYPDLDMPWWPEDIKDWLIYDKYFYVASNSCADTIGAELVIFADREAILENQLTDPLELVVGKKWTLDKLYEYTSAFHGLYTASSKDSPYYALIFDNISKCHQLYYGAGNKSNKAVLKNGNKLPSLAFTEKGEIDRITQTINKVLKFVNTDECVILNEGDRRLMQSRSCVFCLCSLRDIMETSDDKPYAALPPPMFDEDQGEYYSCPCGAYSLFCVPVSADNPEHSAMLIEAIACSDYNEIAPLFFEKKLKMRYTRSELGATVFDIIRDALVLDFFRLQDDALRGENYFMNAISSGTNDFATAISSANDKGQLTRLVQTLLASYKKNN